MSDISKVTGSNYVTTFDVQGNDALYLTGDYFTDFKGYNDIMAQKYGAMSAEEARAYVVGVLAAKGPESIGGDGSLNLTEEQYYNMLTVWDNDNNYEDDNKSKLGSSEITAMAYMLMEVERVSEVQPDYNSALAITSLFDNYDSFSNSKNYSNVLVWANQLAAFDNPEYNTINRVFDQGKDGTFDFTATELVNMYESYAPYASYANSSEGMSTLLYNSLNDDNTINYRELLQQSMYQTNNASSLNLDTYFGRLDFDNLSEEQKASIISFAFVTSSHSGLYEPNWGELVSAINNGDMDYVNNTLLPSMGGYTVGFHVTDEYIEKQSQIDAELVANEEVEKPSHDYTPNAPDYENRLRSQYGIMDELYGAAATSSGIGSFTPAQYEQMNSELSDDSYFKLTPEEIASLSEAGDANRTKAFGNASYAPESAKMNAYYAGYAQAFNEIMDTKCEAMADDIARLMEENADRVNHGEFMSVLSEAGYSEIELRAFMEHENAKHRGEEGYVPYNIWGTVSSQEEYNRMGAEGGKMFAAYISGSGFMDAFSANNEDVNNINIEPEYNEDTIEDPDDVEEPDKVEEPKDDTPSNEDIVRDDDSEVRPDTDTHVVEKGDINASNVDVMIQNILYPAAGESEEATRYMEETILTEENLNGMNDRLDAIFEENSEDLEGRNNLTEDDIKMLTILYNQDPQIVDDEYLENYIFASDVERKDMLADKVTDWMNDPEATGKNVLTANMIMESLSGGKREVLDILKLESVDVAFGNADDIHVNTFFNEGLTGETLLMVDQILTSQYESGEITEDQYMDRCEELEDKAYHMAAMANDIVEQTASLEFLMDDYVEDHGQTHEEALKTYIEQYAADHPDEDVMSWEELEDRMNNPEKYLYELDEDGNPILDENGEPVVANGDMYRWNFANGELPPDTPDDIRDAYRIYMLDKAVGDGEGGVDSEKQSEMNSLLRTALTAGIVAFRDVLDDSPLGQKILMMANEWVHRPPVNGTLFQEIWDLDEDVNNRTFEKTVPPVNYESNETSKEDEDVEYATEEQDPEETDPEEAESEEQDPEEQDSEETDPEEAESEEQDPEEQDPEEQEPEEADFEEREFEEIDPEGPGMDEAESEEQDPEEADFEEQDPEEADFEEREFEEVEPETPFVAGGTGASSDEHSGQHVGTDADEDDFSELYDVLDDAADEYTEVSPEDAVIYPAVVDSVLMESDREYAEIDPEESYSEEQDPEEQDPEEQDPEERDVEEQEPEDTLETFVASVENEAETPVVTESDFEERDVEEVDPEYNSVQLTDEDLSQSF